MSKKHQPNPMRPHPVRTQTSLNVDKALIMEQGKRQGDTGKRVNKMDIAAEWLEEKAESVINTK